MLSIIGPRVRKGACAAVFLLGSALFSSNASAAIATFDLTPFTGSTTVGVTVTVSDIVNGVSVEATVVQNPDIGDLTGLFFSIDPFISNLTIQAVTGPITDTIISENNVSGVGNVNINPDGGYDVGVAIGTTGIGSGDDFQYVKFNVLGTGLTADDFTAFAARVMSVGTVGGSRSGSSKLNGDEPGVPPSAIPEPSTYMMLSSAIAALVLGRRRLARQ